LPFGLAVLDTSDEEPSEDEGEADETEVDEEESSSMVVGVAGSF